MKAWMISHMFSKENPMFPMIPLMPMVMFGLLAGNLIMGIRVYRKLAELEHTFTDSVKYQNWESSC